MTTIMIPTPIVECKERVAVPREEYEKFIAWQKKVKSAKTFRPTAQEKAALARARKRRARGEYATLHELRRTLGNTL